MNEEARLLNEAIFAKLAEGRLTSLSDSMDAFIKERMRYGWRGKRAHDEMTIDGIEMGRLLASVSMDVWFKPSEPEAPL
jgi:hypothetical protein